MQECVFLSYRREDAAGYAGRLYDRLKTQFPGRVFIDVGEIEPGTDFVAALEQAIMRSRVLLVVIGKRWLNERLPYSSDFVRVEIAAALKRNMRLIPVLVGGRQCLPLAICPRISPRSCGARHSS
jgi:hypothetical protein